MSLTCSPTMQDVAFSHADSEEVVSSVKLRVTGMNGRILRDDLWLHHGTRCQVRLLLFRFRKFVTSSADSCPLRPYNRNADNSRYVALWTGVRCRDEVDERVDYVPFMTEVFLRILRRWCTIACRAHSFLHDGVSGDRGRCSRSPERNSYVTGYYWECSSFTHGGWG